MINKNSNKKTGLRYPAINDLVAKADNKYELVLATAKRAREIVDGSDPLVIIDVNNPVSIATKEIDEDVVRILSYDDQILGTEETFPEEENLGEGFSTVDIAEGLVEENKPEEACEDEPEAPVTEETEASEEVVEEIEEAEE